MKKRTSFYHLTQFLILIILLYPSNSFSREILGTGTSALIGGDLTDPENNGVDGSNTNWNWTSIQASVENYWSSEGAYNVFDNKVGSNDAKWCCAGAPEWIYVQFSQAYVLTHFTITSGNDVWGRDPDIWRIQGSNNGTEWTDIFVYNNDGVSPFGFTRHQVIRYNGNGDDFATPAAYSYFRYYVNSTIVDGAHQINELEFFGDADSTAPTLSSSSPSDNATGIAKDSNIVLNFSENVDVESGNITIKKTSDDSTVETIDVTGAQVTGTGTSQITINPTSDLDELVEYYVLIDATAFDDSSSNSYAGISSTTALSFTTSDTANPTLSSSSPSDNATGIAKDSNIVLNFSENVDVESGNITIKKTSDDSTVETIDVTGAQVTGTGTSQITINPSSDFDYGIEYYVLIDATAFDDSSSNSYAGISSTTALSFTVSSLTDPTTLSNVTGSIDAMGNLSNVLIKQSIRNISNRLTYVRQNRSNDNLSNLNAKLDFMNNTTLSSLISHYGQAIPISNNFTEKIIPKNWHPWSEGVISVTKIGDDNNNPSREIDTQSLAFGFDNKVSANKIYGFAFQYAKSDSEVGSNGTTADSENYNFAWYGTKPFKDKKFVEGSLGFGFIDTDLVRKNGANTLTGSRSGNQVFGSINLVTPIFDRFKRDYYKISSLKKPILDENIKSSYQSRGLKNFNLSSSVKIDLGYTELNAYSETGTDALSYSRQYIKSGVAWLGLNFSNVSEFDDKTFKPFGAIEYGLDFSDSSESKLNYVSDTSTIYTYKGANNSSHYLTGEIGFDFEVKNNLTINTSYKRIQGNDDEKTDMLKIGFKTIGNRQTDYTFDLNGNDELIANLGIGKKIKGFEFDLTADQSLNTNKQNLNLLLSKKF